VSEEGEGQKHEKLQENITKVISIIPKEKYYVGRNTYNLSKKRYESIVIFN
jgi:hypothetical protein